MQRPEGKPADTSLLGVGVGDYIPGICKQSLLCSRQLAANLPHPRLHPD